MPCYLSRDSGRRSFGAHYLQSKWRPCCCFCCCCCLVSMFSPILDFQMLPCLIQGWLNRFSLTGLEKKAVLANNDARELIRRIYLKWFRIKLRTMIYFPLEILLLCAKCLTLLYSPSFLKLWLVKFQASPFTGLEAQDQDIGDFFL